LYILDVGEQDFHQLKRDQSILVEFNIFPSKLIELIDLCTLSSPSELQSTSSINDKSSLSSSSSYTVRLDESTGILSIVEANMFKQLTHISLQLRLGDDNAIKSYLAARLQMTTSLARELKNDLNSTQQKLKMEQTQKQQIVIEIQELRFITKYILLNNCNDFSNF
jgi:spindle assembly abnormal protein 6